MEMLSYFFDAEQRGCTDEGSWDNNPVAIIPKYHRKCKMPQD